MGRYDWSVICGATVNNNYSKTQAAITVSAIWKNNDWSYQIASTQTVSADDQTASWSGAVDSTGVGYNGSVNVGSRTFYVNKGENARQVGCSATIHDASGNAYAGGYTRTGYASVTVAALDKYTISFDANGGSGAPAAIQKSHGIAKDLPTAIPTRTGYEFLGWATTSTGAASYSAGASYNGNADATLYATWKALASTGRANRGTIGSAIDFSWTRYVSSYTHKVYVSYGSHSDVLIGNNVATSCRWTPPIEWCNETPNATSGVGTWRVETYSGNTFLGSNTYQLTLDVPASVVPSFTKTLSNVNTYFTVYTTKESKLRAVFSTSGIYGSTVTKAYLNYDGIEYSANVSNNSATITTNELNIAGTRTATLTIVDSRGRTATATEDITVYEYNQPRIDSIDIDINGTTVSVNVKGAIAAVNNLNNKFITIKKVRTSDEQETTMLPRTSLAGFDFDKTVVETISDIGTETYNFIAIIEDKVTSATGNHLSGIICTSKFAGGKGYAFFGEAFEEGIDYYTDEGDVAQLSMTTDEWQEIYELLGLEPDEVDE